MADNIDKALNGLAIRTTLPNDWLVTIVNPATGEPAENMTVAKFVEELTGKIPEASISGKGLMSSSYYDRYVRTFGVDINDFPSNKKVNTGFYDIGLYILTDASGLFEVVGITAYTEIPFHVAGVNMLSDGTSEGFYIKRDQNDGNIFVTNKYTRNRYFTMWRT